MGEQEDQSVLDILHNARQGSPTSPITSPTITTEKTTTKIPHYPPLIFSILKLKDSL